MEDCSRYSESPSLSFSPPSAFLPPSTATAFDRKKPIVVNLFYISHCLNRFEKCNSTPCTGIQLKPSFSTGHCFIQEPINVPINRLSPSFLMIIPHHVILCRSQRFYHSSVVHIQELVRPHRVQYSPIQVSQRHRREYTSPCLFAKCNCLCRTSIRFFSLNMSLSASIRALIDSTPRNTAFMLRFGSYCSLTQSTHALRTCSSQTLLMESWNPLLDYSSTQRQIQITKPFCKTKYLIRAFFSALITFTIVTNIHVTIFIIEEQR